MSDQKLPEVWLRGPVAGVPVALQPAAHALLAAAEEVESVCASVSREELWQKPADAASIGYHLMHLAGATDRLFTYARGESLSESQVAAMKKERLEGEGSPMELSLRVKDAVGAALDQLRSTPPDRLYEAREVGRAKLPSTVIGLLFHAAEHAQRHAGQIATTLRVLRAGK